MLVFFSPAGNAQTDRWLPNSKEAYEGRSAGKTFEEKIKAAKEAKIECFKNLEKLSRAVALYNIDNPPKFNSISHAQVSRPDNFLVRHGYLKEHIHSPTFKCIYQSDGDFSKGGQIVCKFHGRLAKTFDLWGKDIAERPISEIPPPPAQNFLNLESPLLPLAATSAGTLDHEVYEPPAMVPFSVRQKNATSTIRDFDIEFFEDSKTFKEFKAYMDFSKIRREDRELESIKLHLQMLKKTKVMNACLANLRLLNESVIAFYRDHPEEEIAGFKQGNSVEGCEMLFRLGYLKQKVSPPSSTCRYRQGLNPLIPLQICCTEHGHPSTEPTP